MAQFQLLRCSIALAGDTDHTVVRHRGTPILLPELMVIQFLHGADAVTDLHVVGTCEMSMDEALMRLRQIYQEDVVAKVFPGNRPRLPTQDQSIPLCTQPIHKPQPTRPDSPDPKLRPLDQYTMPVEDVDDMPGFDNPVPYDEEADQLEQEIDQELLGTERSASRPTVEGLPQTRTSFRGQARQARRTPTSLPDVAGPQKEKRSGQHDHDRPKG